MHGLTFIALARSAASQRRWAEEDRIREKRMERFRQLSFQQADDLSPEQQETLDTVREELHNSPHGDSDRLCPECQRPMCHVIVSSIEIDACRWCRGIWFDPGELSVFSGQTSDVPSRDLTNRSSKYECPICQKTMREHVFKSPATLLVDACPDDHGVYLEDKELERIFRIS